MGKLTGKATKLNAVLVLAIIMVFVMVLAGSLSALGAEPEFRLEMDNLNLQMGVSCNLTVSLLNAQGAELTGLAGIENFEVLSQNSATSIGITNGVNSFREDRHFTIIPKTTGQFALQATVSYQGQTYETNILQVTVGESSTEAGAAESDLFVKTNLSKTQAYLGEKIIVTYELYTRYSIENYGFTDYTAFDGLIAKDTPQEQLKSEYVYLDGVRYAKYEAKQLILDPIKAATHIIPSFNMQVNVITDNGLGSGFGGFGGGFGSFFSSSQAQYLQTPEKELTVKPLPQAGKPKNFSGIVGQLEINGDYSKSELNYGDSLLLNVTVSGHCNLDSLKKVITSSLPGFTVYETQKNSIESIMNNQYYTQKDFEIIIVPEKTGALNIAPITISYFDPATEQYSQAEIAGITIEVLGEMPAPLQFADNGQAIPLETVKITQVNYTDTNNAYYTINLNKQLFYQILIALAVLLILVALLIWLRIKRRQQDLTMKSLYRQLQATQDINEAYNIFGAMIKHRYNLSIKATSKSAVFNRLPKQDIAAKVADIMDYMETGEKRACANLKDKIKNIYKLDVGSGLAPDRTGHP